MHISIITHCKLYRMYLISNFLKADSTWDFNNSINILQVAPSVWYPKGIIPLNVLTTLKSKLKLSLKGPMNNEHWEYYLDKGRGRIPPSIISSTVIYPGSSMHVTLICLKQQETNLNISSIENMGQATHILRSNGMKRWIKDR